MSPKAVFFAICICLLPSTALWGQPPMYAMSNETVDDCEGILTDSNAGQNGEDYDHNENLTFSICIPGATEITMQFLSFCVEQSFDSIRFYDGPDTNSMQLGPSYTGLNTPPVITATSGCLTINFISDANVACFGWEAVWDTDVDPPIPPNFLPIDNVPCESGMLTFEFDSPIPCDSVFPAAFTISGAQSPTVTDAQALNCVNGMTTMIALTVNPILSASGSYLITYNGKYLDPCGTIWDLVSNGPFMIIDCPIEVTIEADPDLICEGGCTDLFANATGGNPNAYSYTWAPGPLPNTDVVQVCPDSTTTYYVTVSDDSGALPGTDSFVLVVTAAPLINGGIDLSLCQSDTPFVLSVNVPGGVFTGNGILDEDTGLYDPGTAGPGMDLVQYELGDCIGSLNITITPLDQGIDDAACPGSAPFFVSGGLPAGGTWSGPFIQPNGLFDPSTPGSYVVTYTHPNGCSGSKTINVDSISVTFPDTVCQSEDPFLIDVVPFGGLWSGPGIIDVNTGEFDPDDANNGDNVLTYTINGGCSITITIHRKEIDAGGNITRCPFQGPILLPGTPSPPGGYWTGSGILDSLTGVFDPGLFNHGQNITVTYHQGGCSDDRLVRIRRTRITMDDTQYYCPTDPPQPLTYNTTGRTPGGGIWTGPGVVNVGGLNFQFQPGVAGPGVHTLIYTVNTCYDSIHFVVFPIPQVTNELVCDQQAPFQLTGTPAGGFWQGNGIVDGNLGLFDPAVAGFGVHFISYESPDGCFGFGQITVDTVPEVSILGFGNSHCFKDTNYQIIGLPAGGTFTGPLEPGNIFNPALAGPGIHSITYSIGSGECANSISLTTQVSEPMDLVMAFENDSICPGDFVSISADASGGQPLSTYDYFWDNGIGFGKTHLVNPTGQITYTVTATDYCSDPVTGSLSVYVHPQILASAISGEPVCYEDLTFAEVEAYPGSDYSFTWLVNPPVMGARFESNPGDYTVQILDTITGCKYELDVELPGYGLLVADFSLDPADGACLSIFDAEVEVIDKSIGAIAGYWDFGDGTRIPYKFGDVIQHTYADTGQYIISLEIWNEGDCADSLFLPVCIHPDFRLYVPNAFTPNYDGNNDVMRVKGTNILDFHVKIFNRYGELMAESSDMNNCWDGTHDGLPVKQDVYVYQIEFQALYANGVQTKQGYITVVR